MGLFGLGAQHRTPNGYRLGRELTHADLVKLIIAHYIKLPLESVPLVNMDNAAASLMVFHPDASRPPTVLCFNWTCPALWLDAARKNA